MRGQLGRLLVQSEGRGGLLGRSSLKWERLAENTFDLFIEGIPLEEWGGSIFLFHAAPFSLKELLSETFPYVPEMGLEPVYLSDVVSKPVTEKEFKNARR